jgi:hypothetical protein
MSKTPRSDQARAPSTSAPKAADPAAAEFAQSLLSQMQRDFVTAPQAAAAEKANAAVAAQALLGQMHQDFVTRDREKKEAAANLAAALLNKVTRDFGTIPPPAAATAASVTTESDADLQAAGATDTPTLSAEDLAELDAMVAPTGFWGKLVDRMRGRK